MNMRETVQENPLLASMRNVPLERTEDYVGAVIRGGVRFFEVAMNTPHALEQIRLIRNSFGKEILVGAGTVLTAEAAEKAVESGAQFLLSPSSDEQVLAYCQENDIMMMPGVLTPSDVALCLRYGFSTLKLFPAGGMSAGYVKLLKGPFDNTEYVAIGGVTPENLTDFFRQGCIGAGLGSSLVPKEAAAKGDWEACAAYVRAMVDKIEKVRGRG